MNMIAALNKTDEVKSLCKKKQKQSNNKIKHKQLN